MPPLNSDDPSHSRTLEPAPPSPPLPAAVAPSPAAPRRPKQYGRWNFWAMLYLCGLSTVSTGITVFSPPTVRHDTSREEEEVAERRAEKAREFLHVMQEFMESDLTDPAPCTESGGSFPQIMSGCLHEARHDRTANFRRVEAAVRTFRFLHKGWVAKDCPDGERRDFLRRMAFNLIGRIHNSKTDDRDFDLEKLAALQTPVQSAGDYFERCFATWPRQPNP